MTKECDECQTLEKRFIAVRSRIRRLLLAGKVTEEIMERLDSLDREEMDVLSAIIEHQIQHRLPKA